MHCMLVRVGLGSGILGFGSAVQQLSEIETSASESPEWFKVGCDRGSGKILMPVHLARLESDDSEQKLIKLILDRHGRLAIARL